MILAHHMGEEVVAGFIAGSAGLGSALLVLARARVAAARRELRARLRRATRPEPRANEPPERFG